MSDYSVDIAIPSGPSVASSSHIGLIVAIVIVLVALFAFVLVKAIKKQKNKDTVEEAYLVGNKLEIKEETTLDNSKVENLNEENKEE